MTYRARSVAIGLSAVLIAVAVCGSAIFAQEKSPTPKPSPSPSPPPKAPQAASPAPKETDDRTPSNCVIYVEKDPDTDPKLHDPEHGVANNSEIAASAAALEVKNRKDEPTIDSTTVKVDKDHNFSSAFNALTENKKCCKKIDIVGHGRSDGALELPYDNPGAPPVAAGATERELIGAKSLGGMPASTSPGGKWLKKFVEELVGDKKIKGALCPPPAKSTSVTFHGCWTGKPGFNIAQQVALLGGIQTEGYVEIATFTGDKDHPDAPGLVPMGETKKYDKDGNEVSMVIPGASVRQDQQYAIVRPGIPSKETAYISYGTAYIATDSENYCTFGDGTGMEYAYTPANDNGDAITPVSYGGSTVTPGTTVTPGGGKTPGDTPQSAGTPPMTDKTPTPGTPPMTDKTATPGTPPTTDNTSTPIATKTDNTPTPTTTKTDNTPTPSTTKTDDTPTPTAHVTIYIKASQAVLEGGQTGEPIQGQIVMILLNDKPVVPSTAEEKTANDVGYNRPALKGVTGATGQVPIDVPTEDLPLFTPKPLPSIAGKPVNNLRVSLNLMKHNGGVVETTGRTLPDLKSSAIGPNVLVELFNVGPRTFARIGENTPYGKTDDLVERIRKLFGMPVEIDICIVKEPGPPLGSEPASYGALNHELPQTSVKLRKSTRAMAGVP